MSRQRWGWTLLCFLMATLNYFFVVYNCSTSNDGVWIIDLFVGSFCLGVGIALIGMDP